jgi:hypothetical protein
VILATHDLGRHVAGSSGSFFGVVRADLSRDAEIGDSQVPVLLEDEVLRLDVAVDDAVLVNELEAEDDARAEEL